MADIDWTEGPFSGGTPISDGRCRVFLDGKNTGQNANCAISVCNTRGDGQDAYLNVVSGPTYYRTIKESCEPKDSGGRAPGPAAVEAGTDQYVQAGATPENYARRYTIRGTILSAKPELRVESMTIEEMEEFWERARNDTIRLLGPTVQKRVSIQSIFGLLK
jgi:hypothetical protein